MTMEPKSSQKEAPRRPKWSPGAPQEAPREAQEAPRGPQDDAKSGPRAPQEPPKRRRRSKKGFMFRFRSRGGSGRPPGAILERFLVHFGVLLGAPRHAPPAFFEALVLQPSAALAALFLLAGLAFGGRRSCLKWPATLGKTRCRHAPSSNRRGERAQRATEALRDTFGVPA